ncbi:MAG TPA: FtsX-like permease family protein, partial [Candidatus Binataceae bacterium]
MIFRRDYLEEALGQPGFVNAYWVRVDSSSAVPQVIAALDEGFANSSAETLTESEASFYGAFLDSYRAFFRLAEFLSFIVVVTIALVAANTAAMSIRERRGEIAVMRSIGFPSSTILFLLVAESLVIGLIGGVIGCGAAFIVLKIVSRASLMGPLSPIITMPPYVLVETIV